MLNKVVILILMAVIFLLISISYALKQARTLHRDPVVLWNQYYRLKNRDSEAARRALAIILKQNINDLTAMRELQLLSHAEKTVQQAMPSLKTLACVPTDPKTLGSAYGVQKNSLARLSGKQVVIDAVFSELHPWIWDNLSPVNGAECSFLPGYASVASVDHLLKPEEGTTPQHTIYAPGSFEQSKETLRLRQTEDAFFQQFYAEKQTNKSEALALIERKIQSHPRQIRFLKEAGYLAIEQQNYPLAIQYFNQVEALEPQADVRMQLAYLYDQVGNKRAAWQYFKKAAQLQDNQAQWLKTQNALTQLAGLQTKAMPAPYFGEVYFSPFTQSRFGLTVRPLIARFGIESLTGMQVKQYLVFRQTDDNRSENLGELPQIFEDNVRIMGAGIQMVPFASLPVSFFVEAGAAYDLIPQSRSRWRGDLRANLVYYQELGAHPCYVAKPKFSMAYYNTLYGNVAYFSRYHNNVIAGFNTHQGVRLFQYRSSMINLYLSGRAMVDTRREFFNNIAEIGPGVSFIPNNRYRLQLRFESVNGMYLPAGGSFNPYHKYYTNRIAQLLFYVKI